MDGGTILEHVYNLIPLDNGFSSDHPCLRYPEVKAAVIELLHATGNLHKPPSWQSGHHDLLDWMAFFFGFQNANVQNQREHLVLHLANLHMRRPDPPKPDNLSSIDHNILRSFREKLLENYEEWCTHLGVTSNILAAEHGSGGDLLYVSLYLLIWGESANLRFLPECICYIFHHMAMELNRIVQNHVDESTGELSMPAYSGDNAFLDRVVKPIYDAMFSELVNAGVGIAQYAKWRNYDDFNEYFWSRRCFDELKWPLDDTCKFFGGAGKTGYVERRSFWNLFRSFSRLWLMMILFLQGAIIVAWEGKKNPFESLSSNRDVKVRVLTVFVTWSCLNLWESILDMLMQYKLISRDTLFVGLKMILNILVSILWTASFAWLYLQIWLKGNDKSSKQEVDRFLKVAVAFVVLRIWPFVVSVLLPARISELFNKKKWRILMMFSRRSDEYIGQRGLREGLSDYAKYSAFWMVVLATKFYFSYSLLILPMVNSTKELWNLKSVDYKWHEVFDKRNGAAIVLLWIPVTLIYVMDVQMWFSVYSFFVSATVGLFSRLGEIQDIRQLKLRFGDFVHQVAYKFDLVAEDHPLFQRSTTRSNRFGFGWFDMNEHRASPRIKKLESDPVMLNKFSILWNEIITSFREEDIVSEIEVELLEMPPNHWNIRVICWPCFLLCNELDIAVRTAEELGDSPDEMLWKKICKNEYRRSAVIEVYDSIRYLLLDQMIDPSTEEHAMVSELFQELDHALEHQIFTQTFNLYRIYEIRHLIIKFVYSLTEPHRYPRPHTIRALQNLYFAVIQDFRVLKTCAQLNDENLFEKAVRLPHETFVRPLRRLHSILSSKDRWWHSPIGWELKLIAMQDFPSGEEAKRRISFFCNSVFMKIPRAPSVEKMKAFSVLTPYFKEDVLYSREKLLKLNNDGISLLHYLKTIYNDDWENFMERMRRQGMENESEVWSTKLIDLRLWASYRGQTLARTVRGMMYYRRAIAILAFLDSQVDVAHNPDPDDQDVSSTHDSDLWNHDVRFDVDDAQGDLSSRLDSQPNNNMDATEDYSDVQSRLERSCDHDDDVQFGKDDTEGSDLPMDLIARDESSRLESLQYLEPQINVQGDEESGENDIFTVKGIEGPTSIRRERMIFFDSASDPEDEEIVGETYNDEYDVFPQNSIFDRQEDGIVEMKYTYVVACQNYAKQKRENDQCSDDILYLLKNNEAMRVAYVDVVQISRVRFEYYSVLVKYDWKLDKEVEIYRIKLPGSCMLGEGKPENQNQAIIFTRGDAVQTIDMNQDNYLEEALKMPNLLEEFDRYYGIRKPTIIGLREHIFTGSVSSLAWFMSAQETGFVTSGQRVQANPLKIRMHYGHPDVFDRIWFMARGGISKATRAINICEDIFAGFNCTLRGGNITHHEYIQVGKGRDVSLDQISLFEAKIAGGSAGQLISRDIYRLGHQLDFFRMLSLFHSTVGFYFSSILVIWAIYAIQWSQVYLSLSGLGAAVDNGSIKSAFTAVFGVQLIQLIQYTGLPVIVEDALEHGLFSALKDFFTMQMQFSSVFYTFSLGTRGHYFGRAILHGGAKYLGTGREIVVQHRSFAEMYRLYARSHFVKAIELALLITIYIAYSPSDYGTYAFIDTNISFWFLVISWMLAPFIFNPRGFEWFNTVQDFNDFKRWIWFPSDTFTKPEQSWETWWNKEQRHLRTTGYAGKILEVILNLRFFFFQYGIVYRMNISSGRTGLGVYLMSWIFVAAALLIVMVLSYADNKYAAKAHIYYRLVQFITLSVVFLTISSLFLFTTLKGVDLFSSILVLIPTGWGLVSIAQVFRITLEKTVFWTIIVSVARIYDLLFGVIIIAPVAIISWFPGISKLQTRMLFNDAYLRGLQMHLFFKGDQLQKDD